MYDGVVLEEAAAGVSATASIHRRLPAPSVEATCVIP
jgi:hypothetical protein